MCIDIHYLFITITKCGYNSFCLLSPEVDEVAFCQYCTNCIEIRLIQEAETPFLFSHRTQNLFSVQHFEDKLHLFGFVSKPTTHKIKTLRCRNLWTCHFMINYLYVCVVTDTPPCSIYF